MREHPMRLLARLNRHLTNPLFLPIAARIPGYANVIHIGRRTGRRYRTPVGITWHGPQLRTALNYGPHSDWTRNILAAGRFDLEHRGRRLTLTDPQLTTIDGRPFLTAVIDDR
ncbi:nitroreductase/quinone reductase family protein [Nocardia sp. NPDC050406]|uniref:nitroreductase/quinone reductase family protein n=1 Tax=Nocardia sp. NPDC050406 TaxID=3364318 RepID=UPI003799BFA6